MSADNEASCTGRRKDIMQKAMRNDSSSNDDDDTFEDLAGSANNSIIGKVKSRVSSIIPSSLSKWFSPSTRNNDSLNGSFRAGTARRRRRLEIEDDDEYVGDDDGDINEDCIVLRKEFNENLSGHVDKVNNDFEEGDSDKSEDGSINESVVSKQRTHRTVKPCGYNQPPSKRSRISVDASSIHHPPFVASTPAIGISHRNINHAPNENTTKIRPTSSNVEENVYNYKIADKIGPYSFPPQKKLAKNTISNEKELDNFAAISSRRTLHLPSTSQAAKERELSTAFSNCQRQSISGNIQKADTQSQEDSPLSKNKQPTDLPEVMLRRNANGNTLLLTGAKKQRLNGTDPEENNADDDDSVSDSSEDLLGNSSDLHNNIPSVQRKTGLFNMSNLNSQNDNKSRTSSFGNGINFYSHLEGRKSLFSGPANASGSTNVLNNSTLSLTSLNRRQFNASIYGSTSALSDSRLLNTFSPFYKGKTTYGGAAAYKKYSSGTGANKIFNITPTIIRPTSSLSTLSSSNNSASANAGGAIASGGLSNNGTENPSAISNTAKRILDLINDFATPLSEAKKMANSSVKTNLQLLPQTKSRINESDLQASRAIRLSQIRTPYTRPAVTLLPTIKNTILPPPVKELQVPSMSQLLQMKKMQSTTERSRQITMQNSSSTTCSIARSSDYVLPVSNENNTDYKECTQARPQQQQQPHTNKIKSKVRVSSRITASKNAANIEADEAPVPVNLPNIAFPLMQSVPKFDIDLPKPQAAASATDSTKFDLSTPKSLFEKQPANDSGSSNSSVFTNKNSFTFSANSKKIVSPIRDLNNIKNEKKSLAEEMQMNFKFSAPFTFVCDGASVPAQQNLTANTKTYTFSAPKALGSEDKASYSSSPAKSVVVQTDGTTVLPQLKSGSVLDALKKPFSLLSDTKEKKLIAGVTEANSGFGDQFTNATMNKWECDTCLIRNESNMEKCVACETPRAKPVTTTSKVTAGTPFASGSLSLSAQFKKSSDEWECDVCMIRNKQHVDKCVACETPRKGRELSIICATNKWQSNSFGDAFKPKSNTWECPTCLINNQSDCSECVACQTKHPGSGRDGVNSSNAFTTNNNQNTTQFKFGFGDTTSATFVRPTVSVTLDSGFKSIAASQMSAKWECDACMTRNDAARNKCVCCEQAKPGTTTLDVTENGPKFAFGTAASSKFSFGFVDGVNGTSTTETGKVPASVDGSNEKTDEGTAKGFVFGNTATAAASTQFPAGAGSFSFGIKPSLASNEKQADKKTDVSKDVADNGKSSAKTSNELINSGFKFTTTTSSKDVLTNNATSNFKFGVPSTTAAVDASSSMPGRTPTVNFNSKTSATVVGAVSTQSTITTAAPSSKDTTGSFTFGNNSTATTVTQPSTGGFSIGTPSKTTGAKTTTTTTATTFSLGSSIFTTLADQASAASTTTTSTATIKPMFSFGSTTSSTKPVESAAKTPITSTPSSNNSLPTTAFSKPTGGFSFGITVPGSSSASTATKPVFGGFVAPTAVSKASTIGTASAENTLPPASTNVFGSFGSTSSATTTTTSATPTVVSPAASIATNTNLFGNISQAVAPNACDESKPTASATMIFGSTGNATNTDNKTTTAAPFIFGSSSSNSVTQGAANNTTTSGSIVAAATSWPKGGFSFGSGTSNGGEPQKPIFGSFVSAAASQSTAKSGSVFGSLGGSNTTPNANSSFGSVAANATSPSTLFSANASTIAAVAPIPPSLFGNVSAAASSFGSPPAFGSSGNNNANSSTLTFGATSNSATFGSIGAAAANARSDGASAPKKSEPAFNFGGNTSQMGSSGGFNFGAPASAVVKPAFNFTASSAPAFNFTGSSSDTAKPFQFGAAQPAPVFNFSSGAEEATPNAPFQFNAGTTPAPSNIFAPTPSASNAPGAMQVRRKIRQPTRRLTPR
ncbi:nuclear pore complex protein Nup153 isoform X1 [Ceratitis capitata]|uniref:Nuclear pore complex protein Nup153 n=1 Tax=Ceratitis capitata TaxID=7213 RepID=W8BPA2_CERCA|nr:nuclear pore complex protein Nup153 isoform X1 [Ceratitis capitata]XP_020716872.1 nuclear pore complex protein Nup153 isoform X1 [Ceratitis capitata]